MDFDADGLEDVISGSYHPGDLFVFRKQTDGIYATPEKILGADGQPVNVGAAAAAYLVDWDADGDLDLVVGNIKGEVWYVPNEGTRDKPAYGKRQQLHAGDKKLVVGGGDAGPIVADWDGDGKLDLIVGAGDGSVLLYRNISDDKAKPKLAEPRTLVPSSRAMFARGADQAAEATSLKHGMRVKPHVVDYNGDGKLDLLIGDFSTAPAEESLTPEQRAARQQAEAKLAELNAEQQRLTAVPDGETQEQRRQRQRELRDVRRQIIEHAQEALKAAQPRRNEPHGYVWLLLRKDAPARTAGAQAGGG